MPFYKMGNDDRPHSRPVEDYIEAGDVHELGTSDNKPPGLTALCGFCGKYYKNEQGLRTHVGKKHPEQKARKDYISGAKLRAEQNKERGE